MAGAGSRPHNLGALLKSNADPPPPAQNHTYFHVSKPEESDERTDAPRSQTDCAHCNEPGDILKCERCACYRICVDCFYSGKISHFKDHNRWLLIAQLQKS